MTAYVPGVTVDDVVSFKLDDPEARLFKLEGENAAVTPLGKPAALNVPDSGSRRNGHLSQVEHQRNGSRNSPAGGADLQHVCTRCGRAGGLHVHRGFSAVAEKVARENVTSTPAGKVPPEGDTVAVNPFSAAALW